MDQRTRAATYQDLLRVAALLEEESVEYALIGGYALALQGIVRLTEDVDVMVEPSIENARRWVRASLEGLLRMKEHGRPKDRADAEAIRKALGQLAP